MKNFLVMFVILVPIAFFISSTIFGADSYASLLQAIIQGREDFSLLSIITLFSGIPSLMFSLSVLFSKKYLNEGKNKKAIWMLPGIFSLVAFFIFLIPIYLTLFECGGAECSWGFLIAPLYLVGGLLITGLFSLLPSIILYRRYMSRKAKEVESGVL